MLTLKIGDKAPAINAIDENGNKITLNQFKGKKIVLYFYPHDNTPTCTVQACNLRDNYGALVKKGYVVIGVSTDTEKSHQKFIAKHNLPFPLIADVEQKVATSYGVWRLKKFMGREFIGMHRTTFIINEKGIIENIIEKVTSKTHANQII